MAKAPTGPTKPEAGVIATRPATAPEQMPMTVGLPFSAHSTSIQVKAATAVAIWVTSMAMPACMPAVTAEPGVESEPANPQQGGADEGEHHVVRRPGLAALAEHDRAHQPCNTGVDMHDSAAGEIQHFTHAASLPAEKMPSGPQTQCAIGA